MSVDRRGGYVSSGRDVGDLPAPPTGPAPGTRHGFWSLTLNRWVDDPADDWADAMGELP